MESVPQHEGIEEKDYSIEHIMPQKLSVPWQKYLGEGHEKLYKVYLNNIGNLTLTGYNPKYSNRPFSENQLMDKGYRESHFVILNAFPAHAVGEKKKLLPAAIL
ncbi:HNH endonuclease family protein [Oceanobacillus longus]|uniref:HNH endonuclease family protein n=1 Tax=Oceanobacillus longus TaxID=930120 RepID=A0ABV8H160_9BACI